MYYATAKEIEQLDTIAVEHGLEIRQMMELAGWHMIGLLDELGIATNQRLTIVCGKGNNGGDGLAAARHLTNHGYQVSAILAEADLKPDAQHHLDLLRTMGVETIDFETEKEKAQQRIGEAHTLVDALLGYHIDGAPRGTIAELITMMEVADVYTISYDLPSGVDATSGECYEPCITADATLSLALPKKLFQTKTGAKVSGTVFIGDLGIPATLYDRVHPNSRPNFGPAGMTRIPL